jgi:hypothetical protein
MALNHAKKSMVISRDQRVKSASMRAAITSGLPLVF